jgi:signal transduction histidine kinase
LRDITEEKRAREALLANEQALRQRFDELETAHRKLEEQGAELSQLADDLKAARDKANAANEAKSQFLANMSHELRTPLNAIIGFAEIMKDEMMGPVGNARYRGYTEDIFRSGSHLLSIINDILDLSKVESGAETLHEDEFAVQTVIQAAVTFVDQRAKKAGVDLASEIGGNLPLLRADERKVKQVLVNLLTNAVKFTPRGGKVTIKAWCREDSGFVFQVADTGIGIAPEDIPKAMSPFGQVDSGLSRKYEGTGLGLPLSKSFVELHGGLFDLQSQVGSGTTVTLRFPAARTVAGRRRKKLLQAAH